jgi:stearoyl-CoA desaturase (delta-9 desaturase)
MSQPDLRASATATIVFDRLQQHQRRHTLAILAIPSLGTAVALALLPWSGVGLVEMGLLLTFYALTSVGITVGFHRLFAHRTFEARRGTRILLGILGCMAAQGPLIYWVSNHRRHHVHSDEPGDPHSPHRDGEERLGLLRGLWHAHVEWSFNQEIPNPARFARDLLRDLDICGVDRRYFLWAGLGLAVPALLDGMLTLSAMGALKGLLWGGCVRLFLTHNFTFSINSICHVFGRRPFPTRERSTNNLWLAVPTLGESWHNNHHAFPNSAIFGLEWWQIDVGAWVVRALKLLGWAWDVKEPSANAVEARKGAA